MPRGLGGSDLQLAAESHMRRGHVSVHVHITRACVHSGPGWGSDGHGPYGHMRPAGRGLGSRIVRPSPWVRISKGRAPTPPFGAGIIIKIL